MSVAQLVRTSVKAGTISSQNSKEMTQQASLMLMKKMFAVAISNIAYIRAMLPECAFRDRYVEGVQIKLLRENGSCYNATGLVKWIHGCFDAIDKHYLKKVVMFVYADKENEDTVIESYSFHFTYKENPTMDIYRNREPILPQATTQATVSLLRTLVILMQTLTPLPDDVALSIKLMYYDDVTPSDYEPIGFRPGKPGPLNYIIEPTNILVGNIETPFNSIKLQVKTDASQFNGPSLETSPKQEDTVFVIQTERSLVDEVVTGSENLVSEAAAETESADTNGAIINMDLEEDSSVIIPREEVKFVDLTNSPEESPKAPAMTFSQSNADLVSDITLKTETLGFENMRMRKIPQNKENCPTNAAYKGVTKRIKHSHNEAFRFEIDGDQLSQEEEFSSVPGVTRRVKRHKTSVAEESLHF